MASLLKILILEDSATDAEIISRLLRKAGILFACKQCMTRDEFISDLATIKPDVILADHELPQFSAVEALEIVTGSTPHIPLILVTGAISDELAVNMLRRGAADYILKDRLERLPLAIESAINLKRAEKEKQEALERMRQSEEKYRTLVERVSDGVISLDAKWNFIYLNRVAERMFKNTADYLVGKSIWEEFPHAVDGPFYPAYLEAMETQRNVTREDYSTVLNLWVQANIYPSPSGLTIYFRDVNEEHIAKEDAKRSEEKLQTFMDRITDGFFALDKDWRFTVLNSHAARLVHHEASELIGKVIWEEFPEIINTPSYHAYHRAVREQRFELNTAYYESLDTWCETHIYPSENGLSVFIRDVSEKIKSEHIVQQSEEARKQLEQKLQEHERKEQVRLTATALQAQEIERNAIGIELHDNVNQLLVGTKLLLSMARNDPARHAEMVTSALGHLQSAIEENRKIAHALVAPDFASIRFTDKLKEITNSMFKVADIGVAINTAEFDEKVLSTEELIALYRIFQEQCTNIVKYARATQVNILLETDSRSLKGCIADNGVGMPSGKKASGIGLRNIKGRLSVLNGSLKIKTGENKGFKLEFIVPLRTDC